MDAFSEILSGVKLNGAVFFTAEFSAPWGLSAPASSMTAATLGLPAAHLVLYHLVVDGEAIVELADGQSTSLGPGDVVVFPHGDPHHISSGKDAIRPFPNYGISAKMKARDLTPLHAGGGGAVSRFVCGYMTCDPYLSRPILNGLPPVFTVNIRTDRAGHWLAGTRDPIVGKSLGLLHGRAAHPWTIADLADEVGISRSALVERFTRYLSEPPMTYLTRWRLQLAARSLEKTSRGVAEIAADVGYESEAAFNRAFKREFGIPPGRYRSDHKTPPAQKRAHA